MRHRGVPVTSQIKEFYDPIDFVGTMKNRPGQRLIVMSDPDDRLAPFRTQREFVERVKAANLPILHITAAAEVENFHGLQREAQNLVVDCAKGVDDESLVARYQTKPAPVGAAPEQ
jgi:hypothetical protein